MSVSLLVIALSTLAVQPEGLSPEIEPARQVTALGEPIDIQREGHACPVFADFDGDGLADLLVGEAYSGRLRIYRNLGTKTAPKFGEYEWLRAGDQIASVAWALGGYKGFAPQLVDLDRDGKTDVISGARRVTDKDPWRGEIVWFRRIEGTRFAPAERLLNVDGTPIETRFGALPSCADWDGDGDIDVVIGTHEGTVLWFENRGSANRPRFAEPVPVMAAGKAVAAPSRKAHPCVADWDGDGRHDLLVGSLDGSVVLYRNSGPAGVPRLAEAVTLIPKSPVKLQDDNVRPKDLSGMQPAVCAVDFDGDGRLDLLLGDGCGGFFGEPRHTPAERERAERNRARLDEVRKEWAEAFQAYRSLTLTVAPKLQGKNEAVEKQIAALRLRIKELDSRIQMAQEEVEYDWPRNHTHGFVWLYRRRP